MRKHMCELCGQRKAIVLWKIPNDHVWLCADCAALDRAMEHRPSLLGGSLAIEVLVTPNTDTLRCAACATRRHWVWMEFAVAYGQPVAVCDRACYLELMGRWRCTPQSGGSKA